MTFEQPLVPGTLLRRYKRFLADIELGDGEVITAHTPNTGSMKGCSEPGSRVWLRHHDNAKRKYRWSWELTETSEGTLVGINTAMTNHLVREAIEAGSIAELRGYATTRAEVRYGRENSRIDLLLEHHPSAPPCYVEVKNVTLAEGSTAAFPDAVSARGAKHLRELVAMVEEGARAVAFFCIQRGDVDRFAPAWDIDPAYAAALVEARSKGVEVLAYRAAVGVDEIVVRDPLPVELG